MKPYTALARVSTPQQAKKYGIAVQLEAIRRYAESNDLDLQDEYVDNISGASENREALFALIDNAEKYQGVIIYDLTRLARTEKLGFTYLEMLEEAGLEVLSVHRGKIENDLMTGIDIVLSAEERRKTAERTKAGLLHVASQGIPPNGIILLGYDWDKNTKKVTINEQEAKIVVDLFTLSASGMAYRKMAKEMMNREIPSPSKSTKKQSYKWFQHTVRRIIKNKAYKGIFEWKHKDEKVTHKIEMPVIISPDLWQKAQKRNVGAKQKLGFPLTGRIKCGICGMALSARKVERANKPVYLYYRCNSHKEPDGKCGLPLINRFEIEKDAEKELRSIVASPKKLREALAITQVRQDNSAQLAELEDERQRVLAQHQKGYISDYELDDNMTRIRAKQSALRSPGSVSYPVDELIQLVKDLSFVEMLKTLDVTVIVMNREEFSIRMNYVNLKEEKLA